MPDISEENDMALDDEDITNSKGKKVTSYGRHGNEEESEDDNDEDNYSDEGDTDDDDLCDNDDDMLVTLFLDLFKIVFLVSTWFTYCTQS